MRLQNYQVLTWVEKRGEERTKFAKSVTPGTEIRASDGEEEKQRTGMNGEGQPRGEQSGLPLEMHHGYYIVVVCFGLESERPFIIQGD